MGKRRRIYDNIDMLYPKQHPDRFDVYCSGDMSRALPDNFSEIECMNLFSASEYFFLWLRTCVSKYKAMAHWFKRSSQIFSVISGKNFLVFFFQIILRK